MKDNNDFDLDLNKDDGNNDPNRISITPSSWPCYSLAESIISMITTTTQFTTDPGYTESKC